MTRNHVTGAMKVQLTAGPGAPGAPTSPSLPGAPYCQTKNIKISPRQKYNTPKG